MKKLLAALTLIVIAATIHMTQAVGDLEERMDKLEEEVRTLQLETIELRQQLGQIYETQGSIEQELDIIYQELDKYDVFEFEATGYAPFDNVSGSCSDGDPNTTATGTRPKHGTIAVNPKVIPYGTKIYVEGYGWGVAEDTGGAIRAREDLIDLYFDTYEEAINWGRRNVKIYVEKGGLDG